MDTNPRPRRAIYLALVPDIREALWRQAEAEARAPKAQAVRLIAEGLRRAGYLSGEPTIPRARIEGKR
jgi:hypothetical protein